MSCSASVRVCRSLIPRAWRAFLPTNRHKLQENCPPVLSLRYVITQAAPSPSGTSPSGASSAGGGGRGATFHAAAPASSASGLQTSASAAAAAAAADGAAARAPVSSTTSSTQIAPGQQRPPASSSRSTAAAGASVPLYQRPIFSGDRLEQSVSSLFSAFRSKPKPAAAATATAATAAAAASVPISQALSSRGAAQPSLEQSHRTPASVATAVAAPNNHGTAASPASYGGGGGRGGGGGAITTASGDHPTPSTSAGAAQQATAATGHASMEVAPEKTREAIEPVRKSGKKPTRKEKSKGSDRGGKQKKVPRRDQVLA